MSKHVAAVLANLRERQTQLAAEQADIGEAIAVLEKMNGGAPATPPPAREAPRASSPSGGRRAKAAARRPETAAAKRDGRATDPALVATARAAWERGDDVKAIAKAASVSPATVYAWSSQHKWKRPAGRGVKGSARPPVAASAAAADPKVEKLAGRVRCESCQQMTETDPCSACGRKLPRKW